MNYVYATKNESCNIKCIKISKINLTLENIFKILVKFAYCPTQPFLFLCIWNLMDFFYNFRRVAKD